MPDITLIEQFKKDIHNRLLQELLEEYKRSLDFSEENQINRLVEKMNREFEERQHAHKTT